ncbi:MAG: cation-translocating P-type ATPase [Promethearchaeota archaeon]
MAFYNLALKEIYQRLHTNPETGLSDKEADFRLGHDGLNELPKHKPKFWKVYLAPLFNWLIVIYLIGAVILFIAGKVQNTEETSTTLLYITLAVVALNCIIAIIQQYRATKKLQALEELSAPTANVMRNGSWTEIPAKKLVVGDIIRLEQGDRIPADSRVIRSMILEVDESSLTGESEPVTKNENSIKKHLLPIQSQQNIVFLGSYVTLGNANAVVIRTGQFNEIGKISKGMESINMRDIPIQKKMNNFGKWLGLSVLGFWVISFFIIWVTTGRANIFKSLNSAMDIMPINIPLLSTIVMITGVLTLATRGVIIRNLTSVESLGRISVLCTDKTGTITEGKMAVQIIILPYSQYIITGSGYKPHGAISLIQNTEELDEITSFDTYFPLKQLIIAGKLGSNATIAKKEQIINKKVYPHWNVIGSPTEGALVTLFEKAKHMLNEVELEEFQFVNEFPFDSSIKLMSKLYNIGSEYVLFTKGAPERILELCSTILQDGKLSPFTDSIKKITQNYINDFSTQGFRALSICQRKLEHKPRNTTREYLEQDYIYLGTVFILDGSRIGVPESIEKTKDAGIDVKMITGDSLLTANSVAKKIGLLQFNDTGIDLTTDSHLDINSSVFARVSPTDKHTIVTQLQENSRIVAMTGDGVNDALALSKADVGIAMGIRGTDVAKEAADMIIANDSFNSIVDGIAEGRGIFARIRAVVFFYIAINVFEGLVQFVLTIILDLPYFLDTDFYLQWIFLSITLHSIPGLILTFDITNKDVMKEKPRDSEEILTKNILILLLSYGVFLAISMCFVYFLCIDGTYSVTPFNIGSENFPYFADISSLQIQGKTLTMLMVTLYFCESILIFQIRRLNKSIVKSVKEDSKWWMFLLIGVLFSIIVLLMYIPGIQNWLAGIKIGDISLNFRFMRLTMWDWLVCAGIASICIIGFELVKLVYRKKGITF